MTVQPVGRFPLQNPHQAGRDGRRVPRDGADGEIRRHDGPKIDRVRGGALERRHLSRRLMDAVLVFNVEGRPGQRRRSRPHRPWHRSPCPPTPTTPTTVEHGGVPLHAEVGVEAVGRQVGAARRLRRGAFIRRCNGGGVVARARTELAIRAAAAILLLLLENFLP